MKLDMFNLRDFIKVNHLQPVTSPIALTSSKMPNPDGIFSYEIFGYTSEDRKNIFSYIDLNGHFLHPQCVKTLNRLGSLGKILSREKYAVVADGKIHITTLEEFPEAETGIDFFYNNWEKIKWNSVAITTTAKEKDEDDLSFDKRNRLKFFALLKKDEAFVDCWLVIPPYYRDMNTEDVTMGDDINKLYNELISRANSLKSGFGFSSFSDLTKSRIQQLLMMIYDISMGPVTGKSVDIKDNGALKGNSKRSLLRRNLIGRYLDFSGYSVISSPSSSMAETVDDFVKFGTILLPLQTFMGMTKPFFVNYCSEFFENAASRIKSIYGATLVKMDATQWSVTEIDKLLTRFIKSASEKDSVILFNAIVKDENGKHEEEISIMIQESDNPELKNAISRPMTFLDLIYIAAAEISKDKYSLNTRHPVTNYQNIYAAKMNVNTTNFTREVYISNIPGESVVKHYKHYPYISYSEITKLYPNIKDPNKKPDIYYDLNRSTVIGNGIIKSLGADYDGDMLFFRALFTKEANKEAENLIWKKTNFFFSDGSLSRGISKIGKDCTMSLYQLTKD